MGSLLLSLGPNVHTTLCVPSNCGVSVSPSPVEVHLTAVSRLSLDVGYLSLVSSSVFLSVVVQQLAVILVLSQEGVSTRPTPPSWTNLSYFFL